MNLRQTHSVSARRQRDAKSSPLLIYVWILYSPVFEGIMHENIQNTANVYTLTLYPYVSIFPIASSHAPGRYVCNVCDVTSHSHISISLRCIWVL